MKATNLPEKNRQGAHLTAKKDKKDSVQRIVVTSWDDGYRLDLKNAELLERYKERRTI